MSGAARARRIVGWVLVCLVGAILVFAGAGKAFGFAPPDVVEGLEKAGLLDWMQIIGGGAMLTGLLLIVPRTSSLGVLLASSYWGGAIVAHMVQPDTILVPSVFLVMTWVGAALRDPRVLASFAGPMGAPPDTDSGAPGESSVFA